MIDGILNLESNKLHYACIILTSQSMKNYFVRSLNQIFFLLNMKSRLNLASSHILIFMAPKASKIKRPYRSWNSNRYQFYFQLITCVYGNMAATGLNKIRLYRTTFYFSNDYSRYSRYISVAKREITSI